MLDKVEKHFETDIYIYIYIYFDKHFCMFRAYLQPVIRRYTVWIQQLVLTVLFKRLSVVLADNRQSFEKNNKYQLLYPYGVPPDDGL